MTISLTRGGVRKMLAKKTSIYDLAIQSLGLSNFAALGCGKGRVEARPRHFSLTSVKLQLTVCPVTIRTFAHKGLKKLYLEDSVRAVPPDTVDKLRKMLAFLDDMQDPEELHSLTAWRAHMLTGDRKGAWSLSVTRNQRLTFRVHTAEREIYDVNLGDYHLEPKEPTPCP